VLAGERKADMVGQAAVDGQDWQFMARALALVPTPASRRRYRWPTLALVGLLALAEVGEVAAALASARTFGDHAFWLATDFFWVAFIVFAACEVARYRVYGYNGAFAIALIRGSWWIMFVVIHHQVSLPLALVYAQLALFAVIAVWATLMRHLLLPQTRLIDAQPKTDAAGVLDFEE
jgi:hypothetical protein